MSVGKITRVPLREVWKHEAFDFTAWLEQNVDVLNEVLDFNLVSAEREQAAGDFSVDLVGEDQDGHTVIVENQLEKSDHDHLGKLLTYLAALDAKAAVWVVSRPRAEHVTAISWLNEATATPFYLVQVEAIRIGDSAPAALFTRIVGPSIEARAAGEAKRGLAERDLVRREFWTLLLERAKERTKLHARISPGSANWVGASSGQRGLSWNYVVRQHEVQVELYIDRGTAEENAAIIEQLHRQRAAVEQACGSDLEGDRLEWQRLEGKRACRIRHNLPIGGWKDRERWPAIADRAIDAMVAFEAALRGPVSNLEFREEES